MDAAPHTLLGSSRFRTLEEKPAYPLEDYVDDVEEAAIRVEAAPVLRSLAREINSNGTLPFEHYLPKIKQVLSDFDSANVRSPWTTFLFLYENFSHYDLFYHIFEKVGIERGTQLAQDMLFDINMSIKSEIPDDEAVSNSMKKMIECLGLRVEDYLPLSHSAWNEDFGKIRAPSQTISEGRACLEISLFGGSHTPTMGAFYTAFKEFEPEFLKMDPEVVMG